MNRVPSVGAVSMPNQSVQATAAASCCFGASGFSFVMVSFLSRGPAPVPDLWCSARALWRERPSVFPDGFGYSTTPLVGAPQTSASPHRESLLHCPVLRRGCRTLAGRQNQPLHATAG